MKEIKVIKKSECLKKVDYGLFWWIKKMDDVSVSILTINLKMNSNKFIRQI